MSEQPDVILQEFGKALDDLGLAFSEATAEPWDLIRLGSGGRNIDRAAAVEWLRRLVENSAGEEFFAIGAGTVGGRACIVASLNNGPTSGANGAFVVKAQRLMPVLLWAAAQFLAANGVETALAQATPEAISGWGMEDAAHV